MPDIIQTAQTAAELVEAVASNEATIIEVKGQITGSSTIRLKRGQALRGTAGSSIVFEAGCDGIGVTADNVVEGLELRTEPQRRALFVERSEKDIGLLRLNRLRIVGCVRLLVEGDAAGGHLDVSDIRILAADARGFAERPTGFGVEIVPAVFTLWNRRKGANSRITATISGVSAGSAAQPVKGTGILIAGTSGGGEMAVSLLETGEVYSDGGIAPGTADLISGGVFVVQGALADEVRNAGPVTTFGPNDMALDNWGRVERWRAECKVTSHGPNGIGFVNLGELGTLHIDALLETHGLGACGFNCGEVKAAGAGVEPASDSPPRYDGTVRQAIFERVVTRGDGAVGIQVAVPIGRVLVKSGVETFGGIGKSLARGVVIDLAAVALSVKPGGAMREFTVNDGLVTHGKGVEALELHGQIGTMQISGAVGPTGGGF